MKSVNRLSLILAIAAILLVACASLLPGAETPSEIRAALATHDRAIHIHDNWVRDPYIILARDGYYYYTGTTQMPTPQAANARYNTGLGRTSRVGWHVRLWRSVNLVTWESLGSPYTLKDTIWYQTERDVFDRAPQQRWRVWAPELHWTGDCWALVHTTPPPLAPRVGGTLVLSAGAEVKGPWTSPLGTRIGRRHDPSLFRDDDGAWWMIWGATQIAPLKPDFSDYAAEPTRIGPSDGAVRMGHEGCLIRKIEGRYILFGTGWSTGKMRKGSYNLYYATAKHITGPYSERKFAGRFLGHGTPFQDRQGRWWCTAFFNANVPPVPDDGIVNRDLSANAFTINQQGLTLVPLDVRLVDGDIFIRAKDPRYAAPGPDEAQGFVGPAEPGS
ncbi:MAG: family 43 glycosylhydrolase [Phycisphaerales bacterium]|nr:MAG: family 43 glycosylhydrolase [Phycisphaerales bacterium]